MRRHVAAALVWVAVRPAAAQVPPPPTSAAVLERVGFDQRLGQSIPLDLVFRDESGAGVKLERFFGEKPVVLALVYYRCPMLCNMVLNATAAAFKTIKFEIGRDFTAVVVSFDSREGPELANQKKAAYLRAYGRPAAGASWSFLTGGEEPIRRLTEACGFRYFYDEAGDQFAHASGIMVLTPDGKISRYLLGLEYAPRDLQLSLVEASAGKIGSLVDKALLLCYRYDPASGKYGFAIMTSLRSASVLLLAALGAFIFLSVRRERRTRRVSEVGAPGGAPDDAARAVYKEGRS